MSVDVPFTINKFSFDRGLVDKIHASQLHFENNLWPIVYILKDEAERQAYVGETTDAPERMRAHLKNEQKQKLSDALLISSNLFNKSATLDIESSLIRYMAADETYRLINGNVGIANHHYFQQKELYEGVFEGVWEELRQRKVVRKTLRDIDNSDLFKYSPYKALSPDQVVSLKQILSALANDGQQTMMVSGSAGTGKSVLAIFLFKLLHTDLETFKFGEFGNEEQEIIDLAEVVKARYPDLKMGLVIPVSSFRKTVARIFSQVKGLKRAMVIGPGAVAKEKYDILLVDEAHRLKQRVNLGAGFGAFDKNSQRLGLMPNATSELQWVLKQSKKAILFYDAGQSIKPSDVNGSEFERIYHDKNTVKLHLKTQLRSKGGIALEQFFDGLLQINIEQAKRLEPFSVKGFDLLLFDRLADLVCSLKQKEKAFGLCRLVAGFAWPWVTEDKKVKRLKDKSQIPTYDMAIDGVTLKWNSVMTDWINSPNAINEVGCIHTVQGYDLNYVGVIFGPEIIYNDQTGLIEVVKKNYYDTNGKNSIKDPKVLHTYILNIYSTMALRGIKGTFIYVTDPALRTYFSQYIKKYIPNEKSDAAISVPLIQLALKDGFLVESGRSTLDIFEEDLTQEGASLIACQINKSKQGEQGAVGLLQIVYEQIVPESDELLVASNQMATPGVIVDQGQVAEKEALYEKQTWQMEAESASRFVTLQLKTREGSLKVVVARFERLLGRVTGKAGGGQ